MIYNISALILSDGMGLILKSSSGEATVINEERPLPPTVVCGS